MDRSLRRGRVLALIRLAWGIALLIGAKRRERLSDREANDVSLLAARVLGGRQIVQGMTELKSWPRWWKADVVIDASHATSLVLLAAMSRRWRRLALEDSLVASVFLTLDFAAAPTR
jgi:hypothetical protein